MASLVIAHNGFCAFVRLPKVSCQRLLPWDSCYFLPPTDGLLATFMQALKGSVRIVGPTLASFFDQTATTLASPVREALVVDELSKLASPLASVARVKPWPLAANHAELCKTFGLKLSTLLAASAMRAE